MDATPDEYGRMIACSLRHSDPVYGRQRAHLAVDRWFDDQAPPEPLTDDCSIARLELEDRIVGKLERVGILKVGQLCLYSVEELEETPGFGVIHVGRIRNSLWQVGFSLKGDNKRK